MPLLEISVIPVGTQSPSFSTIVTDAVRVVEQQGLKYQVTPTATVIEGDIDKLMDVAKSIHKQVANGATRVITNISIDHRTDKELEMSQQVGIVEQSLH